MPRRCHSHGRRYCSDPTMLSVLSKKVCPQVSCNYTSLSFPTEVDNTICVVFVLRTRTVGLVTCNYLIHQTIEPSTEELFISTSLVVVAQLLFKAVTVLNVHHIPKLIYHFQISISHDFLLHLIRGKFFTFETLICHIIINFGP